MSPSWNFPARAEPSCEGSEPGHSNFRAETELTIWKQIFQISQFCFCIMISINFMIFFWIYVAQKSFSSSYGSSQLGSDSSLLYISSKLSCPLFEFSLKVMGSNPGYLYNLFYFNMGDIYKICEKDGRLFSTQVLTKFTTRYGHGGHFAPFIFMWIVDPSAS